MPYYAVVAGRNPGIYSTWDECRQQIDHYPHPWYKKFKTSFEADKCMKSCKQFKSLRSQYLAKSNSALGPYMPEKSAAKMSPINETEVEVETNPNIETVSAKIYNIRKRMGKVIVNFTEKMINLNKRVDSLENEVKSYKSGLFGTLDGAHSLSSSFTQPPRTLAQMCEAYTHHSPQEEGFSLLNTMSPPPPSVTPAPPAAATWDQFPVSPLIEDEEGYIDVYIDGAIRNNGKGLSKGGIGVWFNHDHPLNIAAALEGPVSPVNAEIQAATRAIQQAAAAGLTKLNIHSDSMLMINGITKWVDSSKIHDLQIKRDSPVWGKIEVGLTKLKEAVKNMDSIKWVSNQRKYFISGKPSILFYD